MKKRTRYFIFIFFIAFGIYFLIPTIKWYFFFSEDEKNAARLTGEILKNEVTKKAKKVLEDLKQGKNDPIALKVINERFIKDELKNINLAIEEHNKNYPNEKINKYKPKKHYSFEEINKILSSVMKKQKFVDEFYIDALSDYYRKYYDDKKKVKDSIIKLGLDLQGGAYAVVTINFNDPKTKKELEASKDRAKLERDIIDNAVTIIENRINKYGLSETSIQKLRSQGKIVINLPGVKQVTELKEIIETVGVLEFKIVSKEGSQIFNKIKAEATARGENIFDASTDFSKGIIKLKPEYQAKLPPNTEVLVKSNKDKWGIESEEKQMLVVESTSLLGKNVKISSAAVQQGRYGQYVINFKLSGESATKWAKVTGDNIGREIAIILDNTILENPVVRDKIVGGNSQITLGDAPLEELRTLALILRSGSLNVPLEISEEHVVGASLGQDTIQKGLVAVFLGLIFVLGFMIIWYSGGGIIADIAMALNLILLLSGLALFKGALTLPGIAGVILTIGMAVDANVIIFERIKEEFRAGKTFNTAVQLGFNKAFWTVLDANLTTFAAGIGLSIFGTGPIKGFAVTLCLGIISSLFTALFVSRLLFDTLTGFINFKSLRLLTFRGK